MKSYRTQQKQIKLKIKNVLELLKKKISEKVKLLTFETKCVSIKNTRNFDPLYKQKYLERLHCFTPTNLY